MPLWHDAVKSIPLETREYYLSCLRRDPRSLSDPPRVRVDTIHGAKGLEADRVLLLTDIDGRVRRGTELDPDAEARVWYVGVTRAREALFPVVARNGRGYSL
jgi:superfamily I DNA/RNA helicase